MLCFSIFPLQNKIFISSYFGGDYGDNAKYIIEELNRQGYDYKIIWLLKKSLVNHHHLPTEIKPTVYGSITSFFHMATAKVWINNSRFTYAIHKRKGQVSGIYPNLARWPWYEKGRTGCGESFG